MIIEQVAGAQAVHMTSRKVSYEKYTDLWITKIFNLYQPKKLTLNKSCVVMLFDRER